jgi:hypothetical protein
MMRTIGGQIDSIRPISSSFHERGMIALLITSNDDDWTTGLSSRVAV